MMGERGGETSYYELLEVSASATCEEIEASYQRILTDLESGSLALYSMLDDGQMDRLRSQVDEAYRTLRDPARRAAYDRTGGQPVGQYPSVLVPEEHSGSSVSVGRVEADRAAVRDEQAATGSSQRHGWRSAPPSRVQGAEPVEEQCPARSRAGAAPQQPQPVVLNAPMTASRDRLGGAAAPARTASNEPDDGPRRRQRRLEPQVELEISPDTEFSGALLQRLRESAGATLDDIAELTKINKRYIRALEGNDFDTLPASVYVRGFVSEYARVLGLDAKAVSRSYMSLYERYRGEGGSGGPCV